MSTQSGSRAHTRTRAGVRTALVTLLALAASAEATVAAPGPAQVPAAGEERIVSFPGPGWRHASPGTGITFQGATPEALAGLKVTGSRTGPHEGQVRELRLKTGSVFTPAQPFAPGEHVTVELAAPVHGATGTAFSFRTAVTAADPSLGAATVKPRAKVASAASRRALPCRRETARFRTLPGLRPVPLCVLRKSAATAPGHLLITSRPTTRAPDEQWAAMILSRAGKLVWYSAHQGPVNDLKTVDLGGQRMLAMFQRPSEDVSHYQLFDERYEPVGRILAGNGLQVDSHELQVTPSGTAYLGSYNPVYVGDQKVIDYVVQEVDVPTGDVLFEWHALDHVPLRMSYRRTAGKDVAWDYFHGNSVEPPVADGTTVLVSARHTSAVYGIDRSTGDLRWTLGGRDDDFGIAGGKKARQFCAQHDARWASADEVTLFDNAKMHKDVDGGCPVHPARVMRFRLDTEAMQARVVGAISSKRLSRRGKGVFPYAVGSARPQSNGNTLVNWGTTGLITEMTPAGRTVFALKLGSSSGGRGSWSYRAVRSEWTGAPAGAPAIAAERTGAQAAEVWASWNGKTGIHRWRVVAGEAPDTLDQVAGEAGFADLETRIPARTSAAFVAVQAISRQGEVLGQSEAVDLR